MLVPINQITPSKEALEGHISEIVALVSDNIEDAIALATRLQYMNQVCEGGKKRIADKVVAELQLAKERKDYFGYKIEVCEVGTRYDYSQCGDVILYDLQKELDVLTEKVKARQDFIKALKEPIMIVNPETGEQFKVCPPIKTSTTAPKFTLK
jgi:hypothetical protein